MPGIAAATETSSPTRCLHSSSAMFASTSPTKRSRSRAGSSSLPPSAAYGTAHAHRVGQLTVYVLDRDPGPLPILAASTS